MCCYLETFAKAVDANIIGHNQNFRILTKSEAKRPSPHRKTYTEMVYFLFNEEVLVYIGVTGYLPTRIVQHTYNRRMKFDSLLVFVIDQFGVSRFFAGNVERDCIGLFRPRNNVQGNPDYQNIGGKRVYLPELESILKEETQTH